MGMQVVLAIEQKKEALTRNGGCAAAMCRLQCDALDSKQESKVYPLRVSDLVLVK